MKQKLTIIGVLGMLFLLTGCEQVAAPPNNEALNNEELTVVNNEAGVKQGDTQSSSQVSTNTNSSASPEAQALIKEKSKTSIMLKMIEDGLEIAREPSTQKQGITMIERGISMVASNSKTELSPKAKESLETMQKDLAMLKDEKTLTNGLNAIEKNLAELKANL